MTSRQATWRPTAARQLRDPPDVARTADTEPAVREFAEASVRTIRRLVFPIHGLSIA